MAQSPSKSKLSTTRLRQQALAVRQALRALRQRLPSPVKRALRRTTKWTLHSILGVVISVALIFTAAYVWLPTLLIERKAEIESYLSDTLRNPVTLGELSPNWDGLNPGVRVQGLRVQSATTGEQAFRLKEMRISISWFALLTGRIEINSLVLVEPNLTVERQADGVLRVSGLDASVVPAAEDTDISNLLLSQKEMIIENGELQWLDRKAGENADRLFVRHVALTLHNQGTRHQLTFRADFPPGLCKECQVSADVRGNPVHDPSWSGAIKVRARELSVRGLPIILRDLLPAGLEGRFDLDLASRWDGARPEAIEGRLAVTDLRLPLPDDPAPLTVQGLDTTLSWHGTIESWQLEMDRLRLGLTRAPWLAGKVQVEVEPQQLRMDVEHIEIADVTAFASGLTRQHRVLDWLRAAQPTGNLNRLHLESSGPVLAPSEYRVQGELRTVGFNGYERYPGVKGLSGDLSMTENGGEFRLDSNNLQVFLPHLLREPVPVQSLESRIRWRQNRDDWFVQAQKIQLNARDVRARGEVELRVPKDQSSPVLKAEIGFSDGDGSKASRYYPLTFPAPLREWLERAVIAGRVTDGHVLFHGALANFPFRDGKGRFEARAHVQQGVLEYLPGWEPMRDIDANLYFTGTHMLITSSHARIRGLEVGRTAVAIDEFKPPGGVVITVQARVNGALQETLGVLADSKTPLFTSWVPQGTRAEGQGTLTLDLRIPAQAPKTTAITGMYRFQNNNIEFPFHSVRAEKIQGSMEFNEAGVQVGKLNTRLLGGEAVIEALPGPTPKVAGRIQARGKIAHSGLVQLLGPTLTPYLHGHVPWQLELQPQSARTSARLHLESDLSPLEIRLPAPFAKAQDEALRLVVSTFLDDSRTRIVDLQAGSRAQGKLAFQRETAGWKFTRGRIGIGETVTQLPAQAGLHLSARMPAFNADQWSPILRANLSDRTDGSALRVVSRVNAEAEAVEAFGRKLGRLNLELSQQDGNWRGRLHGDSASGQVAISRPSTTGLPLAVPDIAAPGRATIHLTLEKLVLPAATTSTDEAPVDPRLLPPLHIQSQSFIFSGLNLGELEFSALPATQGWKITRLNLMRPESKLTASGRWEIDSRAQHTSHIDASLTSSDLGRLFEALGYPGEMIGGGLSMQSNWSWSGAPAAFQLAKTDGDLNFTLVKGRVPKISPGAGRLLGALDLRSITRYLSLDFSNVFSKGLSFDRMKAKVVVEQGNAYTRDLHIRTPGADLEISGRIGLAARDLDLDIGVTPQLMEELALTGGLIGGPVVGAAVVVLHNLIRKPFEESTRIKYMVKGGWNNPAVTRLAPAAVEEQEQ